MKLQKRVTAGASLVLCVATVLVAVGACTEGGGAIFATIEQEEPATTSDLPDDATVRAVFSIETTGGEAFLAMGYSLYLGTRESGGSIVWAKDPISLRFGAAETAPYSSGCRGAVWVEGATDADHRIYAVFAVTAEEGDDESTALYRAALTEALVTTPTLQWSLVSLAGAEYAAETPEGVLLANNDLFVTTRSGDTLPLYGLYHVDAAVTTATSALPSGSAVTAPATDVAYHASQYWFVAGYRLFSGTADAVTEYTNTTIALSDTGTQIRYAYGGIHAHAASSTLHLSATDGRLFVLSGSTWTAGDAIYDTGGDDLLAFTDFVSVEDNLYVGTEGQAMYLLTDGLLDADEMADDRYPAKTITELRTATILGMAKVSDILFVRTAGTGLWHQVLGTATALTTTDWTWD